MIWYNSARILIGRRRRNRSRSQSPMWHWRRCTCGCSPFGPAGSRRRRCNPLVLFADLRSRAHSERGWAFLFPFRKMGLILSPSGAIIIHRNLAEGGSSVGGREHHHDAGAGETWVLARLWPRRQPRRGLLKRKPTLVLVFGFHPKGWFFLSSISISGCGLLAVCPNQFAKACQSRPSMLKYLSMIKPW